MLHGDLALKTFEHNSKAERKYQREVKANRRIPQHERIVPLLAAFKHQGKFHLVLPWARGGNLADLFQKYATPKTPKGDGQLVASWYSEDWLLAECSGLAAGLSTVHGAPNAAQIHADIKPENILCFAQGDESLHGFTLKLADFGEARLIDKVNETDERKHVPHTKTYRPPEQDTADVLKLNYDVWCLGCVFLEFLTWAIAGSEAIDDFSDARSEERDESRVTTAMGLVLSDTFFRKISGRPASPFLSFSRQKVTTEDSNKKRSHFRRQYHWLLDYTRTVKALVKEAVKNVSSLYLLLFPLLLEGSY